MSEENIQNAKSRINVSLKVMVTWVVVILSILLAIAIPSFVKARNTSAQHACIQNLRSVDSSKRAAAMAYRLTDGNTMATLSVNEYRFGNTTPVCPSGGTYAYGEIGKDPTCSVTNPAPHYLPPRTKKP